MRLPVVNQCCCGCDLKSGALIIAWIGIVLDLIFIGVFLFFFAILLTVHSNTIDDSETSEKTNEIFGETIVFLVMEFIFLCLHLVLYIMLSIGVNKMRPNYLKYWVTANLCYTILCFIYIPIDASYEYFNDKYNAMYSKIIGGLIAILFQFYFIIVVSSCRKEIVAEIRGTRRNENTTEHMLAKV